MAFGPAAFGGTATNSAEASVRGRPSIVSAKSLTVRPRTGCPDLSTTLTSTVTRSTDDLITGRGGATDLRRLRRCNPDVAAKMAAHDGDTA